MKYTIKEIKELEGYAIEYAAPDNFILSKSNQLFHSKDLKPPFHSLATIDAPGWKQIASKFRLAQRLLRFMVTNVIPLPDGDTFVTFDKSAGIICDGKYFVLKNLVRPCRVLRGACALDNKGNIFFGEYLANDERGEMRIYKYSAGADSLEIIYTFPPNSIKHIHGIYFDKYTDSLFCLTGDAESECRIMKTHDEFKTIDLIGEGDETWRAVSILFDENSFYYGMDAEFRKNLLYKVDRRSLKRTELGEVSGTVFYSKQIGDDLFFATTAENAPSQIENVAAIWHIDKSGKLEQLTSFAKDAHHPTLFGFGVIHFPSINKLENELYFQIVGVKGDGKTYRIGRA